jgi:hypothetical protein
MAALEAEAYLTELEDVEDEAPKSAVEESQSNSAVPAHGENPMISKV